MHRTVWAVAFLFAFAAVADLRTAQRNADYEEMLRIFEATGQPTPEQRALYVSALVRVGAGGRAEIGARKLLADHPADPWSWYAIATAIPDENVAASKKMIELAGQRPDEEMARLYVTALAFSGKAAEALAFLDSQPRTPRLTLARSVPLRVLKDPKAEEALARDGVEALVARGEFLQRAGRIEEAVAAWAQAAKLTPSVYVHQRYWSAIRAQKNVPKEERDAQLGAALTAFEGMRDTPAVWLALSRAYAESGEEARAKAYEERVLREAPRSLQAQSVMNARIHAAEGDERRKAAEAFVAYPHHYDPMMVAEAYLRLLAMIYDSPDATRDQLLRAIEGSRPVADRNPHVSYPTAAFALLKMGEFARAEETARQGLAAGEKYVERMRYRITDPEDLKAIADSQRAAHHGALGWVLFQRGRFDEAEDELRLAWTHDPGSPEIAHHLGRLYESQRLFDKASELYRTGTQLSAPGGHNPNEEALRALFVRRHGSLDGFDAFVREAANARRQEVLAKRAESPKPAPAFALRTLDGRQVTLASLKGRVVVVNFWGIWCSWCVKEMPDFQKLAARYAADPGVAILSINNDPSVDKVRKWMAERKYDFAVLLDDNFASKHVRGYPTTWFIDAEGRLAFEHAGWSDKLLEEFSWRIESLR